MALARESGDFSKVEIEGDHDSAFIPGLEENLSVRQSLETLLTEVQRIVASFAEPLCDSEVDAHVEQ